MAAWNLTISMNNQLQICMANYNLSVADKYDAYIAFYTLYDVVFGTHL